MSRFNIHKFEALSFTEKMKVLRRPGMADKVANARKRLKARIQRARPL